MVKTKNFIELSQLKYGDKYDYSKVNYVNKKTKVIIICPIHGEFEQTPYSHLRGYGCFKCGKCTAGFKKKQKASNMFISRAEKIHGNKYDYSKVVYNGADKKVIIICPIHGEFEIRPYAHLNGQACRECGKLKMEQNKPKPNSIFIEEAKKIHGNKYDYSKVNYVNNKQKVCLICHKINPITGKEHGEFWQRANNVLNNKCGCPSCNSERISLNNAKTHNEFINDAKKIHKERYDYSKAEYKGAHKKVCIICQKHGEFWQTATTHLRGSGCPKCRQSTMENCIEELLINNSIKFKQWYKFEWLINPKTKRRLSLDFYLPEYNIAIECQGIQHFKKVNFSGKGEIFENEKLLITMFRDEIKYENCKKYNLKLIYYTNVDENMVPEDCIYKNDIFFNIESLLKFIKNDNSL